MREIAANQHGTVGQGEREERAAARAFVPSPRDWTLKGMVKRHEVEMDVNMFLELSQDSHPSYPSSMTSVCAWGCRSQCHPMHLDEFGSRVSTVSLA